MRPFASLLKISIKSNFGISALQFRFRREKKKLWEPVMITFGIIVGVGSLLSLYILFIMAMFGAGKMVGHPEIVLTVCLVFTQFIVLFFGIFYVMGAFYFSKDFAILVPLPLKPYEVLGAKFLTVMCNEYLTVVPLVLPPILIYGIGTGQGIFYWLKGILITLAVPAIPLAVGSLFAITLMRFVNLRKSKDLLAIIGGTLGLALAVGINFFLQRLPEGSEEEYLKNLLQSNTGLVEEIGRKFPPAIWATLGLSQPGFDGWLNFLLFIAVSVLLFLFFLWLGNLIFYKGLLAGQEASSGVRGSRKRRTDFTDPTERAETAETTERAGKTDFPETSKSTKKRALKANHPISAIYIREWRLLVRTPIYFLNGFIGNLVGPIILILAFTAGNQSPETLALMKLINDPALMRYVTLGGLGLILFVAGMNTAASTIVSREGSTFWISKLIPVSAEHQVMAKFLNGFTVSVLGVTMTVILMGVFFKFDLTRLAVVFILGLIGAVSLVSVNMVFDVFRPKLVWTNPQEAMKQNFNSLLGMAASLLLTALYAAFIIPFIIFAASEWVTLLSLAAVMGVIGAVSFKCLMLLASRKYRSIESF